MKWLVWLFVLGHALDLHSTAAILENGGAEANPRVAAMLAIGGMGLFILFKMVAVAPLFFFRVRWWQSPLLAWGTAATLAVVVSNYALLGRLT